jgi:hypothetical protein
LAYKYLVVVPLYVLLSGTCREKELSLSHLVRIVDVHPSQLPLSAKLDLSGRDKGKIKLGSSPQERKYVTLLF